MSDQSTRRPVTVLAGLFALVLIAGAALLMWPDRDGPELAETVPPSGTDVASEAPGAIPGAATKDSEVAGIETAADSNGSSTEPPLTEAGREGSQAVGAGGTAPGVEATDRDPTEVASAEADQENLAGRASGQPAAAGDETAAGSQLQPEGGEASEAAETNVTAGTEVAGEVETAGQGTETIVEPGTAAVAVTPSGTVAATSAAASNAEDEQPAAAGAATAVVEESIADANEVVPVVIGEVRGEVVAEPSTAGEIVVARAGELPAPQFGDLVTRGATDLGSADAPAAARDVPEPDTDVQTSDEPAGAAAAESLPDDQAAGTGAAATAVAAASAVFEPAVDLQGLAASAAAGESDRLVPNVVATLPSAEGDVSISAAEAEGGDVYIAGTARPGTRVEVFADGAFVGSAVATATGNWLVEAEAELAQGDIVLSAEAIDAGETELPARVEASFFHAPDTIVLEPLAVQPLIETAEARASGHLPPPTYVIIRRGDNLWRISRRNYGRGIRYEAILAANDELIENPDLIFPGQVFIMPRYDRSWEASVTN